MTERIKATVFNPSLNASFPGGLVSFFQGAFSQFNSPEYVVFPGFCDVHVHFREPGFSYKETILTGSRASARGGYTDVCTMPNLNPVPDSPAHLKEQQLLIDRDACIHVHPYGSITVGQRANALPTWRAWHPPALPSPMTARECSRKK